MPPSNPIEIANGFAMLPAMIVVFFAGCFSTPPIPPNVAIDMIIRESAGKPTGNLSSEDFGRIVALGLLDKEILDLGAMPVFAHAKNLETLNLFDNQIGDLSALSHLGSLKWLNLGKNQITNLVPLKGLSQLKQLYLYHNPNLTKAAVANLQEALPMCNIQHNATK